MYIALICVILFVIYINRKGKNVFLFVSYSRKVCIQLIIFKCNCCPEFETARCRPLPPSLPPLKAKVQSAGKNLNTMAPNLHA